MLKIRCALCRQTDKSSKGYGARSGTRTRMVTWPRDFLTTIAFATASAFVVWTLPSSVLDGECQVSTPSLSGLARRYHRQGFTEFTRIQSKDSSLAAQLLLMDNLFPLRLSSLWRLPFRHPGISAPVWHLPTVPSQSVQCTTGSTVHLPAFLLRLGSLPALDYSSSPALPPAWRKVCGRGISPLHTAVLPNGNCTRLTELPGRCLIAHSLPP